MSQNRPPPHSKSGKPGDKTQRFGEKPKFGEKPRPAGGKFDGPKLSLGGDRGKNERPPQERSPHDRPPMRDPGSRGPHRAPAVPNGAVWLYGLHAVAAALGNPARRLRRLVITEDAQASLAAERPQPWPIQAEISPREKIDQLLGARQGSGIVHQGVALLTDQLAAPALLDALKRPGPILVLDQISDPRNIGALMRTAQAFGAAMVIAQERNAPEETGALAKVASGALELIPLLRIVNIARALIVLKSANVWVVGLDGASPNRLNGAAFAGRRVALVLGNEGEGMRRLTRETCDEIAALGMPGGMESLNVSAAGAVALYELTRS
jgi:23S rRNA (guanosine2251-2'-O)-methyltransferase